MYAVRLTTWTMEKWHEQGRHNRNPVERILHIRSRDGDSFSLRSISEMTSKLTALIEAAKAATPGPWETQGLDKAGQAIVGNKDIELFTCWHHSVGSIEKEMRSNAEFIALANPATILELCALLEKAEKALKAQVEDKRDGPFFHEDEHPKGSCLRNSEEALAAIKQWKEQT